MRMLLITLIVAASGGTASAQGSKQSDSLYVSGEATSSSAFAGGGVDVEWLHVLSARSRVTVGAASMRLGDEAWTYGTLGGLTLRRGVWYTGSVALGVGRSGVAPSPYARLAGAATIPIAKALFAETEAQFARLNGTTVRVVKAGGLYAGVRKTALRVAYIGASSPFQYWQYLFTRGDISFGRGGVLAGLTAGHGPTRLGELEPALLLHTSQEVFAGGSLRVSGVQTTCIAETTQQAGLRLARVMVTVQVPLRSRSVGVTSGASK